MNFPKTKNAIFCIFFVKNTKIAVLLSSRVLFEKLCIYSCFAAKIYAEVFILKNIKGTKSGAGKQFISGAVYVALAVTVVAVTVSTITASFSGGEVTDISENNTIYSGDGDISVKLPDITDFSLDTQVSDTPTGVDAKVTEPDKKSEEAEEKQDASVPKAVEDDSYKETPAPDKSTPQGEEPAEESVALGYDGYIKPCSGYISKEFSLDVPVYSATMYDYRTHSGIDIACDIGTPVKAVNNGVIKEVYNDYMMGTTVVVEHADGICSVYSNLSADLPSGIEAGKQVLTGEIIAGVGETAICESAQVSHLHFEMKNASGYIDPEALLPQ